MGQGPFGFRRPGTAGDDGLFGVDRPFVGAANGVTYTVSLDSARRIVAQNEVPHAIKVKREDLEMVEEEFRNTEQRLQRMRDGVFYGSIRDGERLVDELDRLDDRRLTLQRELDEMKRNPEEHVDPNQAADSVQRFLRERLQGFGISKGPTARLTSSGVEVTLTMVGMDEGDVEAVANEMESLGLQVTNREFFQT